MNEKEKSKFCDEYCKFADESNKYCDAARNCCNGEALQRLINYSKNRLLKHCETCILNEDENEQSSNSLS